MTSSVDPMAGAHPAESVLADHVAGVLGGVESDLVAQHVAGCAACTSVQQDLSAISELLGRLPDPPMPAAVLERISAAVAAERPASRTTQPAVTPSTSATVTPLRSRRPRWAPLGAVAASVTLITVGVLGVRMLTTTDDAGGSDSTVAAAAGGGAATADLVTRSGNDWSAESLRAGVPELLADRERLAATYAQPKAERDLAADAGSEALTAPQAAAPSGLAEASAADAGELSALVSEPQLSQCVAALAGDQTTQALAVDVARYQGEPAAIVLLPAPGDPARADVWVVGPGCDTDVRFFLRTPR